ncbi:MAG: IS200/IS605 family transposase [Bacteroidales bacterium]|jgi:REP element-mobilizing transposase RayT|nr:IS200/IS605 family transposase [Bacteroidales bacterium]
MANTYTSLNIHFVFSTKNRENLIDSNLRYRLHAYIGGIAKEMKTIPLAIGGTGNHVHIFLSMSPTLSPSKCMQTIKTNSSKWIHEEFPSKIGFAWQSGYSGFSVGPRNIFHVKKYIENQEDHHKKKTFEEEYLSFLKETGIEFEEKYLWI